MCEIGGEGGMTGVLAAPLLLPSHILTPDAILACPFHARPLCGYIIPTPIMHTCNPCRASSPQLAALTQDSPVTPFWPHPLCGYSCCHHAHMQTLFTPFHPTL